jgi:hypothetical protein
MKKLSLVVIAAVAILTACNGGVSSSTPETNLQSAARGPAAPDGEEKIGPYIWVWHSVKLKGLHRIEVDCPAGYAVLGGGFKGNAERVDESWPFTVTSWAVFAYDPQGVQETVYASCAPEK